LDPTPLFGLSEQVTIDAEAKQARRHSRRSRSTTGAPSTEGVDKRRGRGVGLWTVRHLVCLMGGAVSLRDAPEGTGAAFEMMIPVELENDGSSMIISRSAALQQSVSKSSGAGSGGEQLGDGAVRSASHGRRRTRTRSRTQGSSPLFPSASTSPHPPLLGKTVWACDDEPLMRRTLYSMLESLGAKKSMIHMFASGKELIKAAMDLERDEEAASNEDGDGEVTPSTTPNLVILDQYLGESLSGLDVATQLTSFKSFSKAKFILCTGAEPSSTTHFDAVLSKPYRRQDFQAVLERLTFPSTPTPLILPSPASLPPSVREEEREA